MVAAGIGASLALNPIAVLPTVISLAVARKLLGSPFWVQVSSKTDKGSIMTTLDMTEQALRQTFIRELGFASEDAGALAGDIMSGAIDAAGVEEIINQTKESAKQVVSDVEDIEQQTRQNLRTTQAPVPQNIPLPEIPDIEMPTLDPLARERLDFDEQLFGRPSRLG